MNNNKLIAEFMGLEYTGSRLKDFDTSWDWLMPVVAKITRDERHWETDQREHLMDIVPYGRIEEVYNTVVEFIKTYNNESYFLCGSCGERCSEYTYSEDRDIDECNECKSSNDEQ